MNNEFKNKMIELSKQINIDLTDKQIDMFYKYMTLLIEWNEKINLTAITNQDEIILKHFIDSITIMKYIEKDKEIVDVGTGAGFPGIPVSIISNNKIILVDSLNKRINFLNEIINKLQLNSIQAIHSRAEDFGQNKNYREKFDISVSRAVANLSTLVEYLLPLVKVGGKCICMKGSDVQEEVESAKYGIKELGGQIEKVDEFCLPGTEIKRNIIIIKKIKETSNKYPRKAGMPSKQPLKTI